MDLCPHLYQFLIRYGTRRRESFINSLGSLGQSGTTDKLRGMFEVEVSNKIGEEQLMTKKGSRKGKSFSIIESFEEGDTNGCTIVARCLHTYTDCL